MTHKSIIRLLLVDDQVILLDVLQRQFDADPAFAVVATAGTLDEAIRKAVENGPDVILLDIELGRESGLDAIQAMRAAAPNSRIIMVSMFDREIYRDRAFELGADAYIHKGVRFENLRDFILGKKPPENKWERHKIWPRPRHSECVRLTLTARELQVVRALAEGRREKEVAQMLGIGVSSVGTYLKRAMVKAGVETRAKLCKDVASLGLETEKSAER